MTSVEPLVCANGPHAAVGPLHDVTPDDSEPRIVCHGCWTLGGLLDESGRRGASREDRS